MNEKNVTYKITGNNNIKAEHAKVYMNNSNIWKTAVFILFVVLITIVNIYHEAWYDEAQAWMIARECSLYEIIFVRPHAEGHPPLWTLILYPMAHNGMDFEVCMKSLMVVISSINTSLILWKSPFPSVVKALLPFTYFFFYQYGAIARPYGLFIMAILLTAITYKNKDDKPWRHVVALIFLCLTSAYGIVIAGSIAIVWVLEIWHGQNIVSFIKEFIYDRRMIPLALLLVCGLLLIYMIIPEKNLWTDIIYIRNNIFIRLIMCFITVPIEDIYGMSFEKYASLKDMRYSETSFSIEIVLGIMFWFVLLYIAKKVKKMLLLILPYTIFGIFAAVEYISIHHTGIMMLYLVFWSWIVCSELEIPEEGYAEYIKVKLYNLDMIKKFTDREKRLLGKCVWIVVILALIIPTGWSVAASYNDITGAYSYGKEMTEFLRKHDMYDLNILVQYDSYKTKNKKEIINSCDNCAAVSMCPYMSDKEIEAFVQLRNKTKYVTQKISSAKENKENYKKVASYGIPDVILGYCNLKKIYGSKVTMDDYVVVKVIPYGYKWKSFQFNNVGLIYVKKDLLKKYNLHEVPLEEVTKYSFGAATQRVNVG